MTHIHKDLKYIRMKLIIKSGRFMINCTSDLDELEF